MIEMYALTGAQKARLENEKPHSEVDLSDLGFANGDLIFRHLPIEEQRNLLRMPQYTSLFTEQSAEDSVGRLLKVKFQSLNAFHWAFHIHAKNLKSVIDGYERVVKAYSDTGVKENSLHATIMQFLRMCRDKNVDVLIYSKLSTYEVE